MADMKISKGTRIYSVTEIKEMLKSQRSQEFEGYISMAPENIRKYIQKIEGSVKGEANEN